MGFLKTATLCLGLGVLVASAYIVKEGDTLWDLSDEFLNDPFAWPDLWENNRHIQDPHWIYPGDSIYFGDSTREDQPVIPTSQNRYPCGGAIADTNLPKGVSAVGCDDKDARNGDFENMLGDLRNRDKRPKKVKKEEDVYLYRQRPAPKIFNGYYQILAPEIYDVEDLKNDESFFSIRSGERKEPILHIPEMEVVVGIGKKTDIKAKKGDLVEILDARAIDVPGTRGKSFDTYAMLRLSGYAKITAVGDTLSRAQIVQSFREIKINQSKARLKKNPKILNVSGYGKEQKSDIKEMASIRYAMDPMLIIGAYSYVLIDKGKEDKFRTGDAIAIWEEDKSDESIPPRLLGRGIITRATEHEAAVLIREIYSNNRRVEIGHKVSVTHREQLVK